MITGDEIPDWAHEVLVKIVHSIQEKDFAFGIRLPDRVYDVYYFHLDEIVEGTIAWRPLEGGDIKVEIAILRKGKLTYDEVVKILERQTSKN